VQRYNARLVILKREGLMDLKQEDQVSQTVIEEENELAIERIPISPDDRPSASIIVIE
jgi:hypothetical protein